MASQNERLARVGKKVTVIRLGVKKPLRGVRGLNEVDLDVSRRDIREWGTTSV